ncbi:MAG TPA: gephyrin-like molybdotransferase Glp, partial [Gemmataceae bacterium]|nr:gephyrin-like molybdotransferase Glp [Gemmataceae bacterium]
MSTPSANPFFDVRMRGFPTRTDVDDVVGLIRERVYRLAGEEVRLHDAAGRVLTAEVVAAVCVPHFDRAAYDGYAVRGEETFGAGEYNPLSLRVVGEAMPGRPFGKALGSGEAVRIMTGSPVPAGADAILPAETAEESGNVLKVTEPVAPGKNVGKTGEDIRAGRTVLPSGRVLRPQDVGLLASIGVASVNVVRPPRVAILVTGDELLPPGAKPVDHRIVDSNSVMLHALVRRDGGEPLATRHLPDDPGAIRAAMSAPDWDVLLVSGGTSVGREDHAPKLVAELGELPVHGVALRPASPAGVGFIGGRPVFLLPGNPVSCLCAYDLFASRAVRRMSGLPDGLPYRTTERPVADKIVSAVGRVDYVRLTDGPDGVRPIAISGASILSTTVNADGFTLVPRDREGYAP